jgi:hypothetical protein
MGKIPVFQTPDLDRAESRMRPGKDHPHAYLGTDQRKLVEILTGDHGAVLNLGLSHGAIADRLDALAREAAAGMGEPVVVDERFEMRVETARGKLPCPFGHPGLYRKTRIELRRLDTGETLAWTDLAAHLIRAHGFYQGTGSPFRLDPKDVARILDL